MPWVLAALSFSRRSSMVAELTEAPDVRSLSARLSELHIGGESNNVCINVTIAGSAAPPKATSAPKVSAPASKAAGKAKKSGKGKRFYVILNSTKEPALKGIWEAEWRALEESFGRARRSRRGRRC